MLTDTLCSLLMFRKCYLEIIHDENDAFTVVADRSVACINPISIIHLGWSCTCAAYASRLKLKEENTVQSGHTHMGFPPHVPRYQGHIRPVATRPAPYALGYAPTLSPPQNPGAAHRRATMVISIITRGVVIVGGGWNTRLMLLLLLLLGADGHWRQSSGWAWPGHGLTASSLAVRQLTTQSDDLLLL